MKLRSIALAGLLGAGLIMTSGCTEDDVKDAITDITKANVVYAVNGYTDSTDITVGGTVYPVTAYNLEAVPLTGDAQTAVSYTKNSNTSDESHFDYGNAHMYIATDNSNCSQAGSLFYVRDSSTGTGKVEVFNLTLSDYDATQETVKVHINGGTVNERVVAITATNSAVASCQKVAATQTLADLNMQVGDTVAVEVNGQTSSAYTIEDNIPTNVDIDLVVFSNDNGVFVPLIKWDDLI